MSNGFFPATAMPDLDWWQALWPDPGYVIAALGVAADMDVVDLCCGYGLFTAPLARLARRVIAVDIDPEMIARARERLTAAGASNCAFVVRDAYEIADMVSGPVDFVLIANTFHGVPEKTRLAKAVGAVLTPGGRLAIVNWHRRPREETTVLGRPRGPKSELRMTPEAVLAAVTPTGLRHARTIELPPYHYGIVFTSNAP
jgi:ubiquinone/menaquinone biosynthesis C-methylase UbiE